MSDLDDLLKVLAEGKRQKAKQNEEAKASLGDFLSVIAEEKSKDPKHQLLKEIKGRVRGDVEGLFGQLKEINPTPVEEPASLTEEVTPQPEQPSSSGLQVVGEFVVENGKFIHASELNEVVVPEVKPAAEQVPMDVIDKYLSQNASFQQPNPDVVDPSIRAIQDKLKFMEQWLGKIAATGPGSGEVNLRYLDDVKRDTIADGRWLKYSAADKKFVFDEINPYEVVYNTTLVETATYTVQDTDWYIGVNRAGPVTITLPASPSSGRVLVIKDESGNASVNPITVLGTVDNDPGGFILQMDNGGIQMVYRSGWRVI